LAAIFMTLDIFSPPPHSVSVLLIGDEHFRCKQIK
jgi:hypothetical protein